MRVARMTMDIDIFREQLKNDGHACLVTICDSKKHYHFILLWWLCVYFCYYSNKQANNIQNAKVRLKTDTCHWLVSELYNHNMKIENKTCFACHLFLFPRRNMHTHHHLFFMPLLFFICFLGVLWGVVSLFSFNCVVIVNSSQAVKLVMFLFFFFIC